LWFRRDLRLSDHPALAAAATAGNGSVAGCFVIDRALVAPAGPTRAAFLAGCLSELDTAMGGALTLRQGPPAPALVRLVAETGATEVFATADFAPYGRRRDAAVATALAAHGATLHLVGSPYAVEPGTLRTRAQNPYAVFTPFRRTWEAHGWPPPLPTPTAAGGLRWVAARSDAAADDLVAPAGTAVPRWWADAGVALGAAPRPPAPGPAAAARRLADFTGGPLERYHWGRDLVGEDGTSRLSPYLRFGCLHPRTVRAALGSATGPGPAAYRSELAWRDFYADVLFHRPASARRTMRPDLRSLRWDSGAAARRRFVRWTSGTTGFGLVDAAMRQLLDEGWMHNRARMVAASFLVKDLHLNWRWGARWFMYRLVDGDLASNQHGWQWTAGTGTDAAPFHRVFNPETQRRRFDPDGRYVARHLAGSADRQPMVDHAAERRDALARLAEARGRR
jgi:deoxyribodipyrimidine photo-lyase